MQLELFDVIHKVKNCFSLSSLADIAELVASVSLSIVDSSPRGLFCQQEGASMIIEPINLLAPDPTIRKLKRSASSRSPKKNHVTDVNVTQFSLTDHFVLAKLNAHRRLIALLRNTVRKRKRTKRALNELIGRYINVSHRIFFSCLKSKPSCFNTTNSCCSPQES
jgi:hypothetical protein